MKYVCGLSRTKILIRLRVAAILAVLILLSAGCQAKFRNGNSSSSDNSPNAGGGSSAPAPTGGGGGGADATAPNAPTGWALTSPASSPSTSTSFQLTGNSDEDGAIVKIYTASNCLSGSVGSATVASGSFTLSASVAAGDGTKTFYYTIEDAVPNRTACAATGKSYVLDTTAPTGPSVSIMGGAANVYTTSVTVDLSASETASVPMQMCVAEANDCSTCIYEAYAATKNLVLGGGGTRRVSAKFKDALGNETACVSDTINVTTLTVSPRYSGATNWNDYATAADTTVACVGSETGSINDCLHGGPARKVVTAEANCANLTMTDSLGVFDWTCGVSGTATFYSTLKPSKGLTDLLQDSTHWNSNSVTLYSNGTPLGASASTTWWSNVLCSLVANNGSCTNGTVSCSDAATGYSCTSNTAVLNKAGAIYSIGADQTSSGYNIGASKIGIVTRGTSTLVFAPVANVAGWPNYGDPGTDDKALIGANNRAFLWIEGNYNGGTQDLVSHNSATLYFGKVDWSTYRNANIRFGYKGIYNVLGNHCLISHVRIADTGQNGLYFHAYETSYGGWRIDQLTVYNAGGTSIVTAGSSYNVFTNLTLSGAPQASSQAGIELDWGEENYSVFANITILNSGSPIRRQGDFLTQNDIFHNILISNGFGNGNVIYGFATSDASFTRNTWSQVAASNSGDEWTNGEVTFSLDYIKDFKFTGNFLLGINPNNSNAALHCAVTNGTNPGIANGTCAAIAPSDWNIVSGVSFLTSFVGKVASDATNASGASGTKAYNLITDFFNFDNWWRVWGVDGSAFANIDNIDQCTGTSTCRIWDTALRATDNVIRNTTGDGQSQNQAFVAGASCPIESGGDNYLDSQTFVQTAQTIKNYGKSAIPSPDTNSNGICDVGETCFIRYLKTATEISGYGNGNGLCETGETCLYSPNFGAYQGHGALQQCTFREGTLPNSITGVSLYGYATNGF